MIEKIYFSLIKENGLVWPQKYYGGLVNSSNGKRKNEETEIYRELIEDDDLSLNELFILWLNQRIIENEI